MEYKTILVHLDRSTHRKSRLEAAFRLAETHQAHLVGLYTSPPFYPPMMITGEVAGVAEIQREYREASRRAFAKVEKDFREGAERAGLSYEWRDAEGAPDDLVALHARYADLVVVGQPDPEEPAATRSEEIAGIVALKAGRPVLAIPYAGRFQTIGARVLIAWDGSREAARAVGDAMPFLTRAEEATVLTINPHDEGHLPGADVSAYLARHGVKANAHRASAKDVEVGESMLSRAADFGSDLIVMGAYGHPRLTEIVFGGATRVLLRHMTVPVLFSH